MPISVAMVAVLGLSREGAPPLEVAQQALVLAGYLDPIELLRGSPAVRMLNDVVSQIDNLPPEATVADRRSAADNVVDEMSDSEVSFALVDLDQFIRSPANLHPSNKQRDLLKPLVQRVAHVLAGKLDVS